MGGDQRSAIAAMLALTGCSLTSLDGFSSPAGPDEPARDVAPDDGGSRPADAAPDASTTGSGTARLDGGAACKDGVVVGARCSSNNDCCSDNCFDGICESNEVGAHCISSTKCNSDNCFEGVCEGNGVGARCVSSTKCDSDSCFDGVCQSRAKGARCASNTKCASGVCVDTVCE